MKLKIKTSDYWVIMYAGKLKFASPPGSSFADFVKGILFICARMVDDHYAAQVIIDYNG